MIIERTTGNYIVLTYQLTEKYLLMVIQIDIITKVCLELQSQEVSSFKYY